MKRMRLMQYDLLLQHTPEMDEETRERAIRTLAELEKQLAAT
jgi:diketogulonate reductase-like aldo/keto reductase